MSFSRFRETRNRSGSNSSPQPPPSTPRVFLPPSHYAAAAGVDYLHNSTTANDASSVSSGSQGTSILYPTQSPSDFSTSDSDTVHTGIGLVSRLARRSSSKRTNSGSSGSKSDRPVSISKQKKRGSQIGDLAMVETQLLPSLRDTIERMTHPTSPISTKDVPILSSYISPQSLESHYANRPMPGSRNFDVSPSNSGPMPTLISAPKPILKSALRTPTIPSVATTFSPPVKSLRSVKSMTSTPKPNVSKINVVSSLTPWATLSRPSRKTSSSSSSRAYSSNPTTPNTSSMAKVRPNVSQPVSRIPTSVGATRTPLFVCHEPSEGIDVGQYQDGDRTPQRFPSPISSEQAPWKTLPTFLRNTNETKSSRSGLGLGLGSELLGIQRQTQPTLFAEDEPGLQFNDIDGDDEISVYESSSDGDIVDPHLLLPRRVDTDEEARMRRRRRETLLAIADGIQLQFGAGTDARESSEYSGFEGWAIGSTESSLVQGELHKRQSTIQTDDDEVSLYSGDGGHISDARKSGDTRAQSEKQNFYLLGGSSNPDGSLEDTWRKNIVRRGEKESHFPSTSDQLGRIPKEVVKSPSDTPPQQHRSVFQSAGRRRNPDSFHGLPSSPGSPHRRVRGNPSAVAVPEPPVPLAMQQNWNQKRSVLIPTPTSPGVHPGISDGPRSVRIPPSGAVRTQSSAHEEDGSRSFNWPAFVDDGGRCMLQPISRDERDSFGIPSSLSYGFRTTAGEGGIPPAESDISLLGRGDLWMEDGEETGESRGLLSIGAEKLFQALAKGNREDVHDKLSIGGSFLIEAPSQDEASDHESRPSHCEQDPELGSLRTRASVVSTDSSSHSIYETDVPEQLWQQPHRERDSINLDSTLASSWRSTLSPPIYLSLLQRYGETEIQRQEVIWRLCESEAMFVKRLRTITRLFIKPLRVQDSSSWIEGVPGNIAKFFDWLEDIMNVHVQIDSALREMCDRQYPVVERAAEVIRVFVSRLEVYQPYLVRAECVVGQIAEEVRLASHGKSDFGEFVTLQQSDEDCEGWSLGMLLSEPVNRLGKYSEMFQTLWNLTPKEHLDHLSTFSLVLSTAMVIRVLHEVKTREDEYDLVKDLSASIEGLSSSVNLARRERRLLAHGPLYRVHVQHRKVSNVDWKNTNDSHAQDKEHSRRSMALLSAINEWDVQRAERSASSATSSLDSYSASSVQTVESTGPSLHSQLAKDERSFSSSSDEEGDTACYNSRSSSPPKTHSKQSLVDVFVFTDVIVLANPLHKQQGRSNAGVRERWRLLDDIGTARVLSVAEVHEVVHGREQHLVALDLLPVDVQRLEAGVISDNTKVTTVYLCLPGRSSKEPDDLITNRRNMWVTAFNQCFQFTLRSLSFPSHSGKYLAHGPNVDLEADTRETVLEILNSGLPLPKSPSIQIEDLSSGKGKDLVQQEREERGWWAVRFRQVFREIQRQDVNLLATGSVSRVGSFSLLKSELDLKRGASVSVKAPSKLDWKSSGESISQSAKEALMPWMR